MQTRSIQESGKRPETGQQPGSGYGDAEQFISNHGITAEWDETTCQNYGEYTSGDSRYQVWLEDADSIKVKLNVMENYGIGGVAEWRLGFEKPEIWDVIGEYLDK